MVMRKIIIEFTQVSDEIIQKVNDLFNKFRSDLPDEEEYTIDFEYETENGVVLPFNEDSHYGTMILTDQESEEWVKFFMSSGVISDNECGMLQITETEFILT
jgi:hypothetical protein